MRLGASSRIFTYKQIFYGNVFKEYSLDCLEFHANYSYLSFMPDRISNLRTMGDDGKLSVHGISVYYFSENEAFRKYAFSSLELMKEYCDQIDASEFTFHLPRITKEVTPEFEEVLFDVMNSDFDVFIENNVRLDYGRLDKLNEFCEEYGTKLNLDLGHLNVRYKKPVLQVLEEHPEVIDKIDYMHVHDNNGEHDSHLPVGDGSIGLESTLEAIELCEPRKVIAEHKNIQNTVSSLEKLRSTDLFRKESVTGTERSSVKP